MTRKSAVLPTDDFVEQWAKTWLFIIVYWGMKSYPVGVIINIDKVSY